MGGGPGRSDTMGPGRVRHQITDGFQADNVDISLPPGFTATTVLRLRAPDHAVLKSIALNGTPWTAFDPKAETISIPANAGHSLTVLAQY